jgi:transcriptional regulator with XRE-family HTH domain
MKIGVCDFDHEKLKKTLEESGLRANWVANKVGIHKRTFSNIVNGLQKPSLPTLKMIAISLGRTEADFIKKE